MQNTMNYPTTSESSLWLQNLVYGLSGMTIKVKHSVYYAASPFQKIEVFDTYGFGRVLCLGGTIVLTERDCGIYHEMMVHPAMLMHGAPKKVCVIGGGDGGCLKEVLKYKGLESVVIVDIDKMVKDTVEVHFPALAKGFKDPRASVVVDDGYLYLKGSKKDKFDIIFVDSYDPGGPVQSLETADFHRFVAERLDEKGIAVIQTDSPTLRKDFLKQTIQSISPLFAQYRPYLCPMASFPDGICSFLSCAKQKGTLDNFDKDRYKAIAAGCTYYNEDIHTGAFLLPAHVKKILK